MNATMRASVLRAIGEITVEHRPVPQPGPQEVLVRISAVGVCGSDTHYFEHGRIGDFVVTGPLVLGHEAAGRITAVGADVDARRVGQRVAIEPGVPDLTCEQCRAGRYNLCAAMRFFATPPIDGAFAEYVTIHHAFAHPLPDGVSDEAGALLEPLSVGVWACRRGGIAAGSRVLVTGAGPIGLLATQVARASGATVTAVDVNRRRLDMARDCGATRTVNLAATDTIPGTYDVLLECSGNSDATTLALHSLRPAGTAVIVGMGATGMPMPVSLIQERELTITGTFRYANTWPTALSLVANGQVDLDSLVSARYPLAEVPAALTAGRRDPAVIKALVLPG
ncbi:NAD(P)-dependent alcohol dehydrogenase [Pseudonocardia sp. CA-107938]|uniref:NAD(P)-dependent alcohol dehydrogenase n=1 Tax=Pseudonocardia sp. CA-107938 TaxID=3240021 RepID=UPI003D8E68A3